MRSPPPAGMATLMDLPVRVRLSYVCFALALLLAFGSHQFLNPVKQAIFLDLVGTGLEPLAKSIVMAILVPVLLIYGVLFSQLADPKLLMVVVGGVLASTYLFIALALHASHGHPGSWLAWLLYYVAECRAVILMPLIWSIIGDLSSPQVATLVYPLIFFMTQVGGIMGSFIAVHASSLGGEVGLLLLQVVTLIVIVALTWAGCTLNSHSEELQEDLERVPIIAGTPVATGTPSIDKMGSSAGQAGLAKRVKQRKAPKGYFYEAFEGLWLLLSRPYAFMTFWVSYATLMPRTILDYTNSVLVKQAYPARVDQVAFWGHMGLVQNSCTAALTLLGTRCILETVGVAYTLLVLPITMMFGIIAICMHQGLWVSAGACVMSSAVAFGLNSTCKEMLYIRTSREIKYKAKSWSEMYGSELMKLLGAQINLWLNNSNDRCFPNCFHPVLTIHMVGVWIAAWLVVAVRVGKEHHRLEADNRIVS